MKILTVDIGNTHTKTAIFEDNKLLSNCIVHSIDEFAKYVCQNKPQVACICSVGADVFQHLELLKSDNITTFHLTHQLHLPFQIDYSTPHTLGMDRVAAVAGALHFFPNKSCLIIDAGTCITYDFIENGITYRGGAIAPGLEMRLQAMHQFTQKLPKPDLHWPENFEGKSTNTSLLSGACIGILDEIDGKIDRYKSRYGDVKVLICGGNAELLSKHTKNNIFAEPLLVLFGLNKIAQFHVNKS